MKSLDEIIDTINKALSKNLSLTFHSEGIVKTTQKGNDVFNYNKDLLPIVPDDKYQVYVYHKLRSERPAIFQTRGKINIYDITANLDLFIYSSSRNYDDFVKSRLCEITDLTLLNIDHDSLKISRQEIPGKILDPSKYFFVVNYQVKYKSSKCYVETCDEC